MGDAPLAGALPAVAGERTAAWYSDAGVDLRLGCRVERIETSRVVLASGDEVTADLVLTAVGARAETAWLDGSALALGRHGLLVDERLRTSDPRVYGVGDVAEWRSRRYGRHVSAQHWDHALRSAEVAAANLLGADEIYDPVPYFWSDQFGRKQQMVGSVSAGDDLLVRGDPADSSCGCSRGCRIGGCERSSA